MIPPFKEQQDLNQVDILHKVDMHQQKTMVELIGRGGGANPQHWTSSQGPAAAANTGGGGGGKGDSQTGGNGGSGIVFIRYET